MHLRRRSCTGAGWTGLPPPPHTPPNAPEAHGRESESVVRSPRETAPSAEYGDPMILSHNAKQPAIDPTASIAPNAVICGEVTIGAGARIGFGAVITAESGPVTIGAECVIMEHAVLRGVRRHPLTIGDNTLIGPHAHLTGCTIGRNSFVATRVTIFNGAVIGEDADLRIGAVVQVRSVLPAHTTVPIHWIAVGDPARILPPAEHDEIWSIQRALDFPKTVFGADRAPDGSADVKAIVSRYARSLRTHERDILLDRGDSRTPPARD